MVSIIPELLVGVTVVLVAKGIVKGIKSLKRKYNYAKNMRKNFANLEREQKILCEMVEVVKTRLGKKVLSYEIWFNEVKDVTDEFEELKIEYQSAHKFLYGIFPSPSAVKLSKRVVMLTEKVISLKNQLHQVAMVVEEAPASVIKKYFDRIFSRILRACFIYF